MRLTRLPASAVTAPASSLSQMIAARQAEQSYAVLVCDCSGSMAESIDGAAKIDRLRAIMGSLSKQERVRLVAFSDRARVCSALPGASGGTVIASAIRLAGTQPKTSRLVIISDGLPQDPDAALAEARASAVPIHTIYIGPGDDEGARFMAELAAAGRGQSSYTGPTLRALESEVRALLGTR